MHLLIVDKNHRLTAKGKTAFEIQRNKQGKKLQKQTCSSSKDFFAVARGLILCNVQVWEQEGKGQCCKYYWKTSGRRKKNKCLLYDSRYHNSVQEVNGDEKYGISEWVPRYLSRLFSDISEVVLSIPYKSKLLQRKLKEFRFI